MLFFANVYMLYYKVYPNLGQGLTLSLYKFILTETRAFPHSRGVIGGHKGKKEMCVCGFTEPFTSLQNANPQGESKANVMLELSILKWPPRRNVLHCTHL